MLACSFLLLTVRQSSAHITVLAWNRFNMASDFRYNVGLNSDVWSLLFVIIGRYDSGFSAFSCCGRPVVANC